MITNSSSLNDDFLLLDDRTCNGVDEARCDDDCSELSFSSTGLASYLTCGYRFHRQQVDNCRRQVVISLIEGDTFRFKTCFERQIFLEKSCRHASLSIWFLKY